VLGPSATFGLYYVANRVAHGGSLGLGGLLTAGRRYFLHGWLWALLNLMVALILGANFLFYSQFAASWDGLLQGIFVGLGLVWPVVRFYALPYLME